MRRLAALGEVVWVTAWDAATRGVLETTFGLPRLRAVDTSGGEPAARLVADWAARSGPGSGWRGIAWVDDPLLGDALDWAESRPYPVDLVRPDPLQGLRDEHVDRVEAFLRGLPA